MQQSLFNLMINNVRESVLVEEFIRLAAPEVLWNLLNSTARGEMKPVKEKILALYQRVLYRKVSCSFFLLLDDRIRILFLSFRVSFRLSHRKS
jgi:hypothetical protein